MFSVEKIKNYLSQIKENDETVNTLFDMINIIKNENVDLRIKLHTEYSKCNHNYIEITSCVGLTSKNCTICNHKYMDF